MNDRDPLTLRTKQFTWNAARYKRQQDVTPGCAEDLFLIDRVTRVVDYQMHSRRLGNAILHSIIPLN